jgi:hypothetical protein
MLQLIPRNRPSPSLTSTGEEGYDACNQHSRKKVILFLFPTLQLLSFGPSFYDLVSLRYRVSCAKRRSLLTLSVLFSESNAAKETCIRTEDERSVQPHLGLTNSLTSVKVAMNVPSDASIAIEQNLVVTSVLQEV